MKLEKVTRAIPAIYAMAMWALRFTCRTGITSKWLRKNSYEKLKREIGRRINRRTGTPIGISIAIKYAFIYLV